MDLHWCQLVERALDAAVGPEVVGAGRDAARERLRAAPDWEIARGQFLGGASDRVVMMLLQRCLSEG
jgi:hypothetical protein